MTQREFEIMSAIQYEGIDNGYYSFVEDIENVTEYFGIETPEFNTLPGKWLVIWRLKDSDCPNDFDPLRFPKRGTTTQAIQPDHVFDAVDQFMLFYKLDDEKDSVKAIRAVNFFAWNQLDSSNYEDVARKIHNTDFYNYKYAEIIYNKNCFAWGACLLHGLPHDEAQRLIDYCLDFYKGWPAI